jgi:hypothetical protein
MMTTDLLTDQPAWQPQRRQPNDLFLLTFRQPLQRNTSRSMQLDRKARCVDPLRSQQFWRVVPPGSTTVDAWVSSAD